MADDRGASRRQELISDTQQSVPRAPLWQQLGYIPECPWSVGLQVELDGVLLPEVHPVMVRDRASESNLRISCAAAFRPVVGKHFVAWRLIVGSATILVFAVQTKSATEDEDEGAGSRYGSRHGQARSRGRVSACF